MTYMASQKYAAVYSLDGTFDKKVIWTMGTTMALELKSEIADISSTQNDGENLRLQDTLKTSGAKGNIK